MKNNQAPLYQIAIHTYMTPKTQWKDITSTTKGIAGVYALLNKTNGKIYIGSSSNLYNRIRDYYSPWYITRYPKLVISMAITKYGRENFAVFILEKCREKDKFIREQYWMDLYKPEYNILTQARGSMRGYKRTEESKAKMRGAPKAQQGNEVKVTDLETGEIITYNSMREMSRLMHCSEHTVANYNKSGKLYLNRYLIQVKTTDTPRDRSSYNG